MNVLVYGGTGSQGGAVVWALLKRGHVPHILTRHPEKAAQMVAAGARTITGDLADKDSLIAASQSMDGVAFMIPAFLEDPTQSVVYAQNAIDAAKIAGVPLIVYNTSGTVINQIVNNPMMDMRLHLIQMLAASGVPYITIEPTAYIENLLGPWTRPNIIGRDVLSYPIEENVRTGWIATQDVGALVAAALEHPELAGRRFGVSGVENVTGPELAEKLGAGIGRSLTYYAMPLDEFAAALDAVFGPGAGEGGKAAYQWQKDNAGLLTMWWDMTSVLDLLPVQMTTITEWGTQFAGAFAPETEQVS